MSLPLVYVLDDEVDITKILERRFQAYGCEVVIFHEYQKTLDAIKARKPKLLVTDINLGDGKTGLDLIKEIKKDPHHAFPIVILSGEGSQSVVAHGIELGANDFLVKPPMKQDFEETISKYLIAENLPEKLEAPFQLISPVKKAAKLKFKVSIEQVHETGLVLLSDHLVKKGTSFHLQGEQLREILPHCDQVFVRVISSASKFVDGKKQFQIHLEIESNQETALSDLKAFLTAKTAEKIKEVRKGD